MRKIRSYSELKLLATMEERFEYLKLNGLVSERTFGGDRFLNQLFYKSYEWRRTRDLIIIRDNACDLGIPGFEIYDEILIHHMNPVSIKQIKEHDPAVLDPEFLICVSKKTHNAIHYGGEISTPKSRKKGDTKLW